ECTTVFVGNLSWDVTEEMLTETFSQSGEVSNVRLITDRETGKKKGFGYVDFATSEAASAACALDGTDVDGRQIRVNLAIAKPKPASAPSATLFVANLSFETTEDSLKEAFEEHGEVVSVRIPTDRESQRPKGFAYVEFGDAASAKVALEAMTGFELDGRTIRLDFSTPRDANGGGRGGRGGFGGGRGGGRGGFGGDRGGRGGRGRGGFGGGRGGFGGGRGGFGGDRGGRGRGGGRGGRGRGGY
ncbi:hypothetical protein BDK51DRAFT_18321, partial [Blyttiomyces helicus]